MSLYSSLGRIAKVPELSLPVYTWQSTRFRAPLVSLGGHHFRSLLVIFPSLLFLPPSSCQPQKAGSGMWLGLWKKASPGPPLQPVPQATLHYVNIENVRLVRLSHSPRRHYGLLKKRYTFPPKKPHLLLWKFQC